MQLLAVQCVHIPEAGGTAIILRTAHILFSVTDTVNALVSLRPTQTMTDIAVMETPIGYTDCSIHARYGKFLPSLHSSLPPIYYFLVVLQLWQLHLHWCGKVSVVPSQFHMHI